MTRQKKFDFQRRSYAGIVMLAALALLAVIVTSLVAFIRSDTFEDWVRGKVNQWAVDNIDGKVEIGDLGFEFLPPKIFAEKVSVSDKHGTKFLTCDKIEIIPDPLSLLKKDLDFDEIAFTGPSINVIIDHNKIVNLPSLKTPTTTSSKKPVLETLSIIDGDVRIQATNSAPWDVTVHLSSINLDVTGEENIVFEVRLLAGKGMIKAGEVARPIDKIETRTTLELTEEFQKLRIKFFSFRAGDIALSLKESELALSKTEGPELSAAFAVSSPLSVLSNLWTRIPGLRGNEACEGLFGYTNEKMTLEASCNFEDVWVGKFQVGTLVSGITLRDDVLTLKDARLTGGGGLLAFDATLGLKGSKPLKMTSTLDGIEISKIFQQLGNRKCGAKFHAYGPLDLEGEMDLEVKGFRIFTGHHANPASREVLNIPKGHAKSALEITDKYFRFKNGVVKIQNTVVTTDTKLNFDKTLDITVQAPVLNASDIKTVAKVPIKGNGKLKCTVKGKMKTPTVVGSATMSAFSFVNVNFGNVAFKLEYSGQGTIRIPSVVAFKGRSAYEISDGKVVFKKRAQGGTLVEGKVHATKVYMSDLRKIFNLESKLLDEIEARSEGDITISYEPGGEGTSVVADLKLEGISVFGETFEKGRLKGQWQSEDIIIDELYMSGKLGAVSISGRKGHNDSIDFYAAFQGIRAAHLKAVDFSSYGVDFTLSAATSVLGTLQMPVVDNAEVKVTDLKLGGVKQADGTIIVNLRNNTVTLAGNLLGSAIQWKSVTDLEEDGATEIVMDVHGLELDQDELKAQTGGLLKDKHTLSATGTIKAAGRLWGGLSIDGNAVLTSLGLKIPGYDIVNSQPVKIGFTHKSLTFKQAYLTAEGTKVKVTGGLDRVGPSVSLQGVVDLKLLKKFTDEIVLAEGSVTPRLLLSGKWSKLYFLGEMGIDCSRLNVRTASLKFSDVKGNVSLDQNTVVMDLGGKVSGGEFLASGTLQLESLKPVAYELYAEFNGLNVRLLKGVPIGLEGTLTLTHPMNAEGLPGIGGEVWVTSLRYTKDFILSQQVENIVTKPHAKDVAVYDKRDEKFALDITIHGSEKLSVKNNLADANFRVDESQHPFKVVGTDILPVMMGTIVVSRGSVQWKGKTFDLERGVIDFTNPSKTSPHFDVLASGEFKEWAITLHAVGTPDDFTVAMSSEPELPEEDILLLIQFGMTREEMAKVENAETVAAEVTSQAIGLDTQIKQLIPIIDQFQITSEFSKQTNKVEPRVTVGKKLTDQIKLSAVSGLTDTEALEKGTYFKAVVEYKVTDSLSIQAAYDNLKGPEAGQDSQQFGNVGVDIKWRIEF
jgi:hypothetical protein